MGLLGWAALGRQASQHGFKTKICKGGAGVLPVKAQMHAQMQHMMCLTPALSRLGSVGMHCWGFVSELQQELYGGQAVARHMQTPLRGVNDRATKGSYLHVLVMMLQAQAHLCIL